MAYSDFTLQTAVRQFGLRAETASIFTVEQRAPVVVPTDLQEVLSLSAGVSLSTMKARGEFIIAPFLLTVRELGGEDKINLFSGEAFDFSPADGLCGVCDFVLCASHPAPLIYNPVVSVVQAPQGDLELGWGICAAQLVAFQRYHQKENALARDVFGCVTTGRTWQFIRLRDNLLTFDTDLLQLTQTELILAAFLAMLS